MACKLLGSWDTVMLIYRSSQMWLFLFSKTRMRAIFVIKLVWMSCNKLLDATG
ncbi:hypothetical protein LINGRAHAP2_LOCUS378 [Linum grandiflorum]